MKKMLYLQNTQGKSQKCDKKSVKKDKKLRGKVFKLLFQGIEALWMLVQILQYVIEFFK